MQEEHRKGFSSVEPPQGGVAEKRFLSRQRIASQVLPTTASEQEPPWQSGNPTTQRSESFSLSSTSSVDPMLQYTQQKRDVSCLLHPRSFFSEAYYNDERQEPEPVAHWRIQQRVGFMHVVTTH